MCTDADVASLALEAQQQHEQILDLVGKGNYDQAKNLLISHINFFFEVIEKVMAKKHRSKRKGFIR
jgi:DNA-binding GntR family transcriptional regulator